MPRSPGRRPPAGDDGGHTGHDDGSDDEARRAGPAVVRGIEAFLPEVEDVVTWLWVALGAAVGAPGRYLTDRWVQLRHDSVFPWGTLAVNVAASFVLGLVTGAAGALAPAVATVVGAGFCGALSTYSTFSYETLRLLETRARVYAVANVVVALGAGFGAAALGWAAGAAVA